MTVRDIMIPRAQMDCVSIDDEPADVHPARASRPSTRASR